MGLRKSSDLDVFDFPTSPARPQVQQPVSLYDEALAADLLLLSEGLPESSSCPSSPISERSVEKGPVTAGVLQGTLHVRRLEAYTARTDAHCLDFLGSSVLVPTTDPAITTPTIPEKPADLHEQGEPPTWTRG